MFDRYRLLLGSIAASTSDDDIAVAASRLSSDTAAYQRGCVERITQLTQLSKQCTDLTSLCDTESEELSKLVHDVKSDTIGTHIHLENYIEKSMDNLVNFHSVWRVLCDQ